MPLDTSTYTLANLRTDGRRWNELRRIHGQMSTQSAADGSSYFEMGNTKIICIVTGPRQTREITREAKLEVEVNVAGFSGVDRKKRSRNDKRTQEMQHTIAQAFGSTIFLKRYPHATISIALHVLSQDGALLAACLNATTLALIDAGVPMKGIIAACTTGSTASYASNDEDADPLLDLNGSEELELPHLTVGTSGDSDELSVLIMETRVQKTRLEAMLTVGLDGCKQVRKVLDAVVKTHGTAMLQARLG